MYIQKLNVFIEKDETQPNWIFRLITNNQQMGFDTEKYTISGLTFNANMEK